MPQEWEARQGSRGKEWLGRMELEDLNFRLAIKTSLELPGQVAKGLRLATAAQDGMARALVPSHTPLDGDLVFAAATGKGARGGDPPVLTELGTVAADCLARAVARGVYEATALPFAGAVPDWRSRFGEHRGGSRK